MEKAHQDIPWVPHAEISPEPCGPGVQRRVLAYSKDAMCVENTFETGGVGAMHCHPHTQITYIVSGRYRFTIGGRDPGSRPRRYPAQAERRHARLRLSGGRRDAGFLYPHAGGLCIIPAHRREK